MNDEVLNKKLKSVISMVFGVTQDEITEETSQDSIEKWDSMGHLNLVNALEEEFNIHFNDAQIVELLNYKLIFHTVKEVLTNKRF